LKFLPKDTDSATEMQTRLHEIWHPFSARWKVAGGISARKDGSMSFSRGSIKEITSNRGRYLSQMGLNISRAVATELVHGAAVARARNSDAGKGMLDPGIRIPSTDALVTDEPGLVLTTTHADCAPIYYYDPVHRAIGLAHAGWRGILAGLPGKVMRRMRTEFGTSPKELWVAIGPTIETSHYEVSAALADAFRNKFGNTVMSNHDGRPHLDLARAAIRDLLKHGLPPQRAPSPPPCTFSDPRFSSYRRDGEACLPMLAWLSLL
jgi:YfiH family protein